MKKNNQNNQFYISIVPGFNRLLILILFLLINAISIFPDSTILSRIYHKEDESRSDQYNEYLTYEGKTYNGYGWKIEALSVIDFENFENSEFQRSFEIAKFLLGEDKEAGFDILEFLYEIDIHEKTKDPIVIDIYLLFAQECEKREIYDAAAKAYKKIADIYDNNGEDEKKAIMYHKATECLKKVTEILLEIINEGSEEEKYNEESNLY